MLRPFDFEKKSKPVTWCVDELIASNTLNFFVSKAGVGKSFLAEYLAVCIVYGHDFLGMKTEPSNVLLIDQDTPKDVLYRRLRRFAEYMKKRELKQKRQLFTQSMNGYSLSDGSLKRRILDADNVSVVIIDSLNSVSGTLDVNKTQDMSVISELKNAVVKEGKTLLIIHHISEHVNMTADEIMTTSDTNKLTMGNSIINQQADTLFYLTGKSHSSLSELYVRPVAKRVALETKPFIAFLIEKGDRLHFRFKGLYEERPQSLCDVDRDILRLFSKMPKKRRTYQVFYDMGSKHGIYSVRHSLRRLAKRGFLIEHKENPMLFTYELGKKGLGCGG